MKTYPFTIWMIFALTGDDLNISTKMWRLSSMWWQSSIKSQYNQNIRWYPPVNYSRYQIT